MHCMNCCDDGVLCRVKADAHRLRFRLLNGQAHSWPQQSDCNQNAPDFLHDQAWLPASQHAFAMLQRLFGRSPKGSFTN